MSSAASPDGARPSLRSCEPSARGTEHVMDMRICTPPTLRPSSEVEGTARRLALRSGTQLTVTSNVRTAVVDADFLYTDVWLSMGEREEDWDERIDQLLAYRVNSAVVAAAGNSDVKFMHCLPALHNRETGIGRQLNDKRGLVALEVTDEVFESPASVVFDQAENQMHTIKALMVATLAREP